MRKRLSTIVGQPKALVTWTQSFFLLFGFYLYRIDEEHVYIVRMVQESRGMTELLRGDDPSHL